MREEREEANAKQQQLRPKKNKTTAEEFRKQDAIVVKRTPSMVDTSRDT